MNNRELMSLLRLFPDEVELGRIDFVINDICPEIADSNYYKWWVQSCRNQQNLQDNLISKLEDAVEYVPEHYEREEV